MQGVSASQSHSVSAGPLSLPRAENDYGVSPKEGGGRAVTVGAKASLHTPNTGLCEL